jgi:hypothetical protein
MTKNEIVNEWLSKEENRKHLDKMEVDKNQYDTYEEYGAIYRYENDEVGLIGRTYFLLIKK